MRDREAMESGGSWYLRSWCRTYGPAEIAIALQSVINGTVEDYSFPFQLFFPIISAGRRNQQHGLEEVR